MMEKLCSLVCKWKMSSAETIAGMGIGWLRENGE
jgi:hypothetical protein